MKWEILKGSEKDFEGMTDDILSILENDLGDRYPFHLSAIAPIGRWLSVAERLPITEPVVNPQLTTEWSGEGLPPVGVECEWLDERGVWMPVKVVYSSKFALVIQGESSLDEKVDIPIDPIMNSDKCKFRPIRSAEDVAREKVRSEECDKIFSILSGVERQGNRSDMAEAIYDAGYRKVE